MQIQKVAVVALKKTDSSSIINYMIKSNIVVIVVILDGIDNDLQIEQDNDLVNYVNLNSDLSCLKDVKWLININFEEKDVDLIHNIYSKVLPYLSDNVIISATSGFFLDVISKMPCNISCNFIIACFFTCDNTIKLIECTYYNDLWNKDFSIKVLIANFSNLVVCNNTPGLILDRIILFWLMISLIAASKFYVSVEESDFIITNKYMGIPNGIFNLLDKIGLENFILKIEYLIKYLPNHDHLCKLYNFIPKIISQMISDGYTGSMSKIGGFYRSYELYDGYRNQVIDLHTGLYRSTHFVDLEFKVYDLFNLKSNYGQFMWYIWSNTLIYISSLIPELSSDISVIDKAIKLAYNWKYGPFELIDLLNDLSGDEFWFFNSIKHDNLPQILSIKKRMYNHEKKCLNINGVYI